MKVEANMVVALRFVMKNEAGEVIEDTMAQAAVEYLHGSGNIMPSLENGIERLHAGDNRHLDFIMGNGESYSMDVVIDSIRPATMEEVARGKPEEKKGGEVCGPGCCC